MVDMTPDQEAMQEKLNNMSPEELMEYQKQNCIFCQIISGKVPSKKIYEDKKCLAILDINPAAAGHILLLPKEHYAVLPQVPEEEISHLFLVAKALSNAMLKGMKVAGTNIFVANGAAAGQRAQHFMIHVIPRKEKDGINCFDVPQRQLTEKDLETIKTRIVGRLGEVMKIKPQPPMGGEQPQEEPQQDPKQEQKEEPKKETPKEQPMPTQGVDLDAVGDLVSKPAAKKKKAPKKKKKAAKKEEDVDLDDIARLLG